MIYDIWHTLLTAPVNNDLLRCWCPTNEAASRTNPVFTVFSRSRSPPFCNIVSPFLPWSTSVSASSHSALETYLG